MDDLISRVAAIDKLDEWDWQEFYLPIHFKELLDELPTFSICADVISRQAAIDAMATWDWQELYLPIHFKQLLEDLPSVSTEKTGRWILTIEDWNKWTCSECGYYEKTDIHVSLGWGYCPKCGAKMEVEE